MFLVVGLGNPEKSYDATRHNIGFRIVKALAAKWGGAFKRQKEAEAQVALVSIEGVKVLLVLPLTYMNSSGVAVRRSLAFFKLQVGDLIVVSDDAAIPFGDVRLRKLGSSGGHHGLESIEEQIQTREYARLRIGIDNPVPGDLVPHVLGRFTEEEETQLSEIIDRGITLLEKWVKENYEKRQTTAV